MRGLLSDGNYRSGGDSARQVQLQQSGDRVSVMGVGDDDAGYGQQRRTDDVPTGAESMRSDGSIGDRAFNGIEKCSPLEGVTQQLNRAFRDSASANNILECIEAGFKLLDKSPEVLERENFFQALFQAEAFLLQSPVNVPQNLKCMVYAQGDVPKLCFLNHMLRLGNSQELAFTCLKKQAAPIPDGYKRAGHYAVVHQLSKYWCEKLADYGSRSLSDLDKYARYRSVVLGYSGFDESAHHVHIAHCCDLVDSSSDIFDVFGIGSDYSPDLRAFVVFYGDAPCLISNLSPHDALNVQINFNSTEKSRTVQLGVRGTMVLSLLKGESISVLDLPLSDPEKAQSCPQGMMQSLVSEYRKEKIPTNKTELIELFNKHIGLFDEHAEDSFSSANRKTYELLKMVESEQEALQGRTMTGGSKDRTKEGYALELGKQCFLYMQEIKDLTGSDDDFTDEIFELIVETYGRVYWDDGRPAVTPLSDQIQGIEEVSWSLKSSDSIEKYLSAKPIIAQLMLKTQFDKVLGSISRDKSVYAFDPGYLDVEDLKAFLRNDYLTKFPPGIAEFQALSLPREGVLFDAQYGSATHKGRAGEDGCCHGVLKNLMTRTSKRGAPVMLVVDGHGGTAVRDEIMNSFIVRLDQQVVSRPLVQALIMTFLELEYLFLSKVQYFQSGAAVSVTVLHGDRLICAHLGDGNTYVGDANHCLDLGAEHHAVNRTEIGRVVEMGGSIVYACGAARLGGEMHVTRNSGAAQFKCTTQKEKGGSYRPVLKGLSCLPVITVYPLVTSLSYSVSGTDGLRAGGVRGTEVSAVALGLENDPRAVAKYLKECSIENQVSEKHFIGDKRRGYECITMVPDEIDDIGVLVGRFRYVGNAPFVPQEKRTVQLVEAEYDKAAWPKYLKNSAIKKQFLEKTDAALVFRRAQGPVSFMDTAGLSCADLQTLLAEKVGGSNEVLGKMYRFMQFSDGPSSDGPSIEGRSLKLKASFEAAFHTGRSGEDGFVKGSLYTGEFVLAVFDGHAGSKVVHDLRVSFIKSLDLHRQHFPLIPALFITLLEFEDRFTCESNSITYGSAGTTAIVAVLSGDQLLVANIGDSRAYLLHESKVIPLSYDHSPESEKDRIERQGSRVLRGRIGPMSVARDLGSSDVKRVIGDRPKDSVTFLPEFSRVSLASYFGEGVQETPKIILASDGLTDGKVEGQVIANIANELKIKGDEDFAGALVKAAVHKQADKKESEIDDITVGVMDIQMDK